MKNELKKILILLLCILCVYTTTYKVQTNYWTPTSPFNQYIYSFVLDSPGNLYAGTWDSGVWRTSDDGNNWIQTGLTDSIITSLAINGSEHIFAGAYGRGVYRSTNQGIDWIRVGLLNLNINCVAINDSGLIFAGIWEDSLLYRSSDNGNSWISCSLGIPDTSIAIVSLAFNSFGHIFAGTVTGNVYRSTNNGDNWTPTSLSCSNAHRILIDDLDYIYVGAYGMYRSTDDGANWDTINNGASTWEVHSIAINSLGFIFRGTYEHVYRSTNYGDKWTDISTGLPNQYVESLVIDPSGLAFAGTWGNGVFRSTYLTTEVENDLSKVPDAYNLSQNYPNPFNPTSKIIYSLPIANHVIIKLFDNLGRELQTLVNEYKNEGNYTISINSSELASGIYYYRMQAGKFFETKKLVVIK